MLVDFLYLVGDEFFEKLAHGVEQVEWSEVIEDSFKFVGREHDYCALSADEEVIELKLRCMM